MNKFLIVLVAVLLVGVGAFYYTREASAPTGDENSAMMGGEDTKKMQEEGMMDEQGKMMDSGMMEPENLIKATDSGFSPAELRVKAGTTVTFKNERSITVTPASAKHPTHTVYPGSDIKKCGTPEQATIFDSCAGIPAGKMWSFTFNEKGTWGYHDHNNPTHFGKIIVE